eukprot:COSAG06_NODE_12873_length_1317_cov_3.841544_2_plen_79_part_00
MLLRSPKKFEDTCFYESYQSLDQLDFWVWEIREWLAFDPARDHIEGSLGLIVGSNVARSSNHSIPAERQFMPRQSQSN